VGKRTIVVGSASEEIDAIVVGVLGRERPPDDGRSGLILSLAMTHPLHERLLEILILGSEVIAEFVDAVEFPPEATVLLFKGFPLIHPLHPTVLSVATILERPTLLLDTLDLPTVQTVEELIEVSDCQIQQVLV